MEEEVRLSYESVKNVDVLDVSAGGSRLLNSDGLRLTVSSQRGLKSGTPQKLRTTTEWPVSRTKLYPGCVIDWPQLGTLKRCSECSPNSTRCLSDRR